MKRWIDLFNELEVGCGVLHIGGNGLAEAGWESARVFDRRVTALTRITDYARGGPPLICLENTTKDGQRTATDLLAILRAMNNEQVKICLDTGHAHISGLEVAGFIHESGSSLRALHIADNLGETDDHMLPCGAGTVPWAAVLKALGEIHYHGLFNFEVPGESKHCQSMPVRLAKLDYALILAQQMIEEISPGNL